mgnify:CR=1 FL=1
MLKWHTPSIGRKEAVCYDQSLIFRPTLYSLLRVWRRTMCNWVCISSCGGSVRTVHAAARISSAPNDSVRGLGRVSTQYFLPRPLLFHSATAPEVK